MAIFRVQNEQNYLSSLFREVTVLNDGSKVVDTSIILMNILPILVGLNSLLLLLYLDKTNITSKIRRNFKPITSIIIALLLLHSLMFTRDYLDKFYFNPYKNRMFVENGELSEILQKIPRNSTIITNDLAYGGYKNGAQMQFPSIYGHQFYGVNFLYHNLSSEKLVHDLYLKKKWFFNGELTKEKLDFLKNSDIDFILIDQSKIKTKDYYPKNLTGKFSIYKVESLFNDISYKNN